MPTFSARQAAAPAASGLPRTADRATIYSVGTIAAIAPTAPATTDSAAPLPSKELEAAPTPEPSPSPTTRAAAPTDRPASPSAAPATVSQAERRQAGWRRLPLPRDTQVVWGGCSTNGTCRPFNFYWSETHEAVLQRGESNMKVQHELCHAHQHWSINGGARLAPSDYDLGSWYSTREGASYMRTVRGLSWPWSNSAINGLEDFAWTCAHWYRDPARLLAVSPTRYQWAEANLP